MTNHIPEWLATPGMLMLEHARGKLKMPKFLQTIERHLMDISVAVLLRLMINVPFQHGKPLSVETLVLMSNGERKRLGDIRAGDEVIADSGMPRQVLEVFEQSSLPVLKIKTFCGRTVHSALDHPFLTTAGYVEAKDLRPGDFLALVPYPKIEDSSGRSEAEFALAGYFVGDGSTGKQGTSNSCRITNIDPAIIADFTRCGESLGFIVRRLPKTISYSFRGKKGTSKKHSAAAYVRDAGLVGSSYTKRVPKWVFRGDRKKVEMFVAAYFDCDGTVNASGNKRIDCCCEFNSVNENLLKDVQHLLLRLGMRSRIRKKVSTYKGEPYLSYRLSLTSMDDVTQFYETIPLIGPKKQRLEEWKHKLKRKTFQAKYLTDEIESIEALEEKEECRCLSVEEDKTFTANDLVVHNTTLCTIYFLAWFIMTFPTKRILLGAHETNYARQRGGEVRDLVDEWGKHIGIHLKKGTKAKDEWVIEGHGGGMVSKGMMGSVQGRPCDLFCIEDPYKDFEDYFSTAKNEQKWNWLTRVAMYRLSNRAPVVIVSSRWGKDDLCGRLLGMKQSPGREWKVVKYRAICEEEDEDDTGRQPGEALFPERVSIEELREKEALSPEQFAVSYQQHDGAGEGSRFLPRDKAGNWLWPRYVDLRTGAWSCERRLPIPGRRIYLRDEMTIFITGDWAWSKKKKADYSALAVFGLTPAGELLVLEVVHNRFGLHELAPAIAALCRCWHPRLVAIESGHPTLREQCGHYPEIPSPRWIKHDSTPKLIRALHAMNMAQAGKIFLPDDNPAWLNPFVNQLLSFTGSDDAHEDMVDCLAFAANLTLELRGYTTAGGGAEPCVLTAGKEATW